MDDHLSNTTVGDIVAHDFRTAAVFERFGIDFCCGAQRTLDQACRTAAAEPEDVVRALDTLSTASAPKDEAASWSMVQLIDYIVANHHSYLRSALPLLGRYLVKLQQVHGARHPELARVRAYFDAMRAELEQHMIKEEQVLFPYIRDLAVAEAQCVPVRSPFGTVANPIRMMEREHRDAADQLRTIRELTNGYTPPNDGCTTYSVCMAELVAFERDLHRHVHLENNILFPRALEIEAERSRV